MSKHSPLHFFRPCESSSSSFYGGLDSGPSVAPSCPAPRPAHQMPAPPHLYSAPLDHAATASAPPANFEGASHVPHLSEPQMGAQMAGGAAYPPASSYMPAYPPHSAPPPYTSMPAMHELDYDPRELEAFAERFKQRRIKLGVTQVSCAV